MPLAKDLVQRKLNELVESEGFDTLEEMLAACIADSVSPAICTAPNCNYTTEMEPDQRAGFCEACGQNTVQSALVLAGII
jgi:ssDNA-binding Zn-finger/Zn-ribbon topoisomerase 1